MFKVRGAFIFVAVVVACTISGSTGRSLQQGCVAAGSTPGAGQSCCQFLKVDANGVCQPCGGGTASPDNRCCDQAVTLPSCLGAPETDADRVGNDVGAATTVASVELCYKACLDQSTCAFFTYTAATSSCQLKDAGAASVSSTTATGTDLYDIRNCRPTIRTSGGVPTCAKYLGGKDVKGADLAGGLDTTLEECYDRCINTPGCLYFKWDNPATPGSLVGRCRVKNFLAGRADGATNLSTNFYDLTACKPATAAVKNGGCLCQTGWNIPLSVVAPIDQLTCSAPCGSTGGTCCYSEGTRASGTECSGSGVCTVDTSSTLLGTCSNSCGSPDDVCCPGAAPCAGTSAMPLFCNANNLCKRCGLDTNEGRTPCPADVSQALGLSPNGCKSGLVIKFSACAAPPLPTLPAGKCWPTKNLFGSPPFVDYFSAHNTYNRWRGNTFCSFQGDTQITVDVKIVVVQKDGSCARCPTTPTCQIWQPDSRGIYRGWCSGTFTGNRIVMKTSFPGDESKQNFGYDAFSHLHYACCCGNSCFKNKFYLKASELNFVVADTRLNTPDETNIATQTAAKGPNYYMHTIGIPVDGDFWFSPGAETDANNLSLLRVSNPTCYKSTPVTWTVRPITQKGVCKQ